MYAVVESGGKQHRVQEGETLKLEKIEVATGESFNFDKVLLVSDGENYKIGAPLVEGSKVTAEVVAVLSVTIAGDGSYVFLLFLACCK